MKSSKVIEIYIYVYIYVMCVRVYTIFESFISFFSYLFISVYIYVQISALFLDGRDEGPPSNGLPNVGTGN